MTSVMQMDFSEEFAAFSAAAKQVETAERSKKAAKAVKSRQGGGTGRKGQKRLPMQDTPLTKGFVYRVKDETTKTVHICVGLGMAEKVVAELEAQDHTLVQYTRTRSGQRMKRPFPYQCILDHTGRKAGYSYSWKPTEDWENAEIHDANQSHEWMAITAYPYHPKGLHFRLTVVDPAAENPNLVGERVSIGRDVEDELLYLKKKVTEGKQIAREVVSVEQWVRAVADLMGTVPTKELCDQVKSYLSRNIVSWPPSPVQLAEIRKGGTLILEGDMCPEDDQKTTHVAIAGPGRYDPHVKVEMHPTWTPTPAKPVYKLILYKDDGEWLEALDGGWGDCMAFVTTELRVKLAEKGWTKHAVMLYDASPNPVEVVDARPDVKVTAKAVDTDDGGNPTRKALRLAIIALKTAAGEAPDITDWAQAAVILEGLARGPFLVDTAEDQGEV